MSNEDIREAYADIREMVFHLDVRTVAMRTASNRLIVPELPNIPPVTQMARSGAFSANWRLHPRLVSHVVDLLKASLEVPNKADLPDTATSAEVDQAGRRFTFAVAELAATLAAEAPADTRKLVDGTEWTRPALNSWSTPKVDALVEDARAALRAWGLVFVRARLDGVRA